MMEYINEISTDSCNKQSCGIFDTHTHTQIVSGRHVLNYVAK